MSSATLNGTAQKRADADFTYASVNRPEPDSGDVQNLDTPKEVETDDLVAESDTYPNNPKGGAIPAPLADPEPDVPVRDQVHAAFDHVAMNFSCPLPMLLAETRQRGIPDEDVQEVIADDEASAMLMGKDNCLYCLRTPAGVAFINRDTGTGGEYLASANELFAELETIVSSLPKKEVANFPPPIDATFRLSGYLRECGEELTEHEAAILNTAQVLNQRFKQGRPVPVKALKRLTVNLSGPMMNREFDASLKALAKRGLCSIHRGPVVELRLIRHCGESLEPPTRFRKLVDTELQEQLLVACRHCCGTGFKNGNVASRAAVKALMMARLNLTKSQFNRIVRELLAGEYLEEVPSKGTTAFRLTDPAKRILAGEPAVPNQAENEAESIVQQEKDKVPDRDLSETVVVFNVNDLPTDEQELTSDQRTFLESSPEQYRQWYLRVFADPERRKGLMTAGDDFSPLTCAILDIVVELCEIDNTTLWLVYYHAEKRGSKWREVSCAMGALTATERLWFRTTREGVVHICLLNVEPEHSFVDMNIALIEGWKEAREFLENEEKRAAEVAAV